MDNDTVQPSNLNRQILHSDSKTGEFKAYSAYDTLCDLNPGTQLETYVDRFSHSTGPEIVNTYDLVIDATDSFKSKYLINDVCVKLGKPDVYGVASGFEGRITVFSYKEGPCLRCLFPDSPQDTVNDIPILSTVPGVIGSLQANEAIKIILGIGEVVYDRMIIFDAKKAEFSHFYLSQNPNCMICG